MIFQVFAVKDELTGKFLQPSFFNDEKEALRTFKYQVNNIAIWRDNSSDFSFYKLGTYDDETGTIIGKIDKISNGRSVLNEA